MLADFAGSIFQRDDAATVSNRAIVMDLFWPIGRACL